MLGLIPVARASDLEREAQQKANAVAQAQPVIQSLAAHVHKRWESAKDAKRDIEERMVDRLRQRRGEYSERKLAEIKKQGGSEIFMNITAVKCRAASAWLRDTMLGTGSDRPWKLDPTPVADLPEDVIAGLRAAVTKQLGPIYASGMPIDDEQLRQYVSALKDQAVRQLQAESRKRVDRMEKKMEDQLVEGGFLRAFGQFIDDLTTFPAACMKGPVMRRRKVMKWQGGTLVPTETIRPEWERVDPFMIYPASWSSNVNEGPLIERHRLTRDSLESLIGVEGYSEGAIKQVLMDFDTGGLREWLWIDTAKALAEGKEADSHNTNDLIDALQLWDSVQGKMLIEWGVPADQIENPEYSYPCELWLIGNIVIKAVLNYDQLGDKPYYLTSYEAIPGTVWGNGVTDLVADPQDMCNASARALANNMGISSGPQVMMNVSRLPQGEEITQMYPWKIWQIVNSDFADPTDPIRFFQPQSNAPELMAVFEKFSNLADEYSGIPKYMTGEHVPGAGRTSSGLSMLLNNAAKGLKQVVSNIDQDVINPLLTKLYYHNLRYSDDPELVGDVHIVARGAMSLVSREAAAVRRNEFMQIVLNSPLAQQIVGVPGAAELLRESAKMLDMNVDKLVPPAEQTEMQMALQTFMQQQAQMQPQQQLPQQGAPLLPDGSPEGGRDSNNFSPRPNGV
jgi:hypothetical protein